MKIKIKGKRSIVEKIKESKTPKPEDSIEKIAELLGAEKVDPNDPNLSGKMKMYLAMSSMTHR